MIWTVCTGHSGCSSASLPACSSSNSGGTTCFNVTISWFIKTTHLLSAHDLQKGSLTHFNTTLPKPCAWLSFQQQFQASQTGSHGCPWSNLSCHGKSTVNYNRKEVPVPGLEKIIYHWILNTSEPSDTTSPYPKCRWSVCNRTYSLSFSFHPPPPHHYASEEKQK